jgi:protein-L-isoaspartate(D-aspartate) O-methyltransferase
MTGRELMLDFDKAREEMVRRQLIPRGIQDPGVLRGMRTVPREKFVPEEMKGSAYDDGPLPIGSGQTISQPYIVALMIQAMELSPSDRVLEIGTGSGYAAAVAGHAAAEVYTVERYEELASTARERLEDLGYDNVHVLVGDGTLGWSEHAPYDGIVVTAGAPDVPEPLREQLRIGGRLVIPVESGAYGQELIRVRREAENDYSRESLGAVRFVPLVGKAGWDGKKR